jgi:hypothetical protein
MVTPAFACVGTEQAKTYKKTQIKSALVLFLVNKFISNIYTIHASNCKTALY